MSKIISFKDIEDMHDEVLSNSIKERVSCGPKRTRITIKDADTNEVLQVVENKVVISGSGHVAAKAFGIDLPFKFPNYNEAMNLENTVPEGTAQENEPVICLFCAADEGCGELDSDIFAANFVDRINPNHMFAFRYVDADNDLSNSEREVYFGRKPLDNNKIAYYFKAFDNAPQIYLRYTDGTELSPVTMYNTQTSQDAECYVQLDLLINRVDFRDYFDQVIGWDKARVSTISLVYAWYTEEEGYKWYQEIIPFTKLNFAAEKLVDKTKALAFEYALFF